jgi:hypothetical protein
LALPPPQSIKVFGDNVGITVERSAFDSYDVSGPRRRSCPNSNWTVHEDDRVPNIARDLAGGE